MPVDLSSDGAALTAALAGAESVSRAEAALAAGIEADVAHSRGQYAEVAKIRAGQAGCPPG